MKEVIGTNLEEETGKKVELVETTAMLGEMMEEMPMPGRTIKMNPQVGEETV